MGPYLPGGEYTDKATFEASGLKQGACFGGKFFVSRAEQRKMGRK